MPGSAKIAMAEYRYPEKRTTRNGRGDRSANPGVRDMEKKMGKLEIQHEIPSQFQDTMTLLHTRWPEAFSGFKPLEIGVREKILQELGAEHKDSINAFLRWYTSSLPYCEQVLAREHRVRLDGTPGDVLTTADKRFAHARLYRNAPPKGEKKRNRRLVAPDLSPDLLAQQQRLGDLASRWSAEARKAQAHLPKQRNKVGDLAFVHADKAYRPILLYRVDRTANGDMVHWITADGAYGRALAKDLYAVPPEKDQSPAASEPEPPASPTEASVLPEPEKELPTRGAQRFGSVLRLKKKDSQTPAEKPYLG
ncbi:ProQ/FINO family protein [Acidithiobacillus caldus]|nr:ProQ/FINO family protein [Acidithiobacillus caldus]